MSLIFDIQNKNKATDQLYRELSLLNSIVFSAILIGSYEKNHTFYEQTSTTGIYYILFFGTSITLGTLTASIIRHQASRIYNYKREISNDDFDGDRFFSKLCYLIESIESPRGRSLQILIDSGYLEYLFHRRCIISAISFITGVLLSIGFITTIFLIPLSSEDHTNIHSNSTQDSEINNIELNEYIFCYTFGWISFIFSILAYITSFAFWPIQSEFFFEKINHKLNMMTQCDPAKLTLAILFQGMYPKQHKNKHLSLINKTPKEVAFMISLFCTNQFSAQPTLNNKALDDYFALLFSRRFPESLNENQIYSPMHCEERDIENQNIFTFSGTQTSTNARLSYGCITRM